MSWLLYAENDSSDNDARCNTKAMSLFPSNSLCFEWVLFDTVFHHDARQKQHVSLKLMFVKCAQYTHAAHTNRDDSRHNNL